MQLQRYLLKADRAAYFGDHFIEGRWICRWYLGENSIGVRKNNPTELPLPDDFLTIDDALVLIPATDLVSPKICLRDDPVYEFMERDTGTREIQDLIELIMSQDTTHVFYSSDYEDGRRPEILTFSKQAPSEELYIAGKTMPIEIDNSMHENISIILKYGSYRKYLEINLVEGLKRVMEKKYG